MEYTNQILLDISEEASKIAQQFEGMLSAEEIEALTARALEDELKYDRQLDRERERKAEERRREKERQEEIARQVAAGSTPAGRRNSSRSRDQSPRGGSQRESGRK